MKPLLKSASQIPIFIIGAGGIVNIAHLPAYKIANFSVQGIFDIDNEKAKSTAEKFNIPKVFTNLNELLGAANENTIFDLAVPGKEVINILEQLPNKANVLLQKPMGENLIEAKKILQTCREKKLNAAVNFQLRYAPFILAAKRINIGEIYDIEINVNVFTPWHLWDFLFTAPRVEILYHSIHYIDLIRNLLGEPKSIFAKTTKHKTMPELASVRSNIIMDYGEYIATSIHTNHCHNFGKEKQESFIKIEGSKGAIKINFGALIDYPNGVHDKFEYVILEESKEPKWKEIKIEGSWFPHAFIGSMQELMLAAIGQNPLPDNSVEDCIKTMELVEKCYK